MTSKHAADEDSKESFTDKIQMAETGQQEAVKEVSDEVTTAIKEQVAQSALTLEKQEKQEKPVIKAPISSDVSTSEKVSEGKSFEVKEQQPSQETFIYESAELPAKKTEQTSQHQPNNQEREKSDDHHDPSLSEVSKMLEDNSARGKTAVAELQTTLHKRENSSGSVDSSWSKLSEEELKANGDKEGRLHTLLRRAKFTL